MARDCWVENLRCPNCRKTGEARLSATDEYSWDVQVDSIPEGFKVLRLENGLLMCVMRHCRGALMTQPMEKSQAWLLENKKAAN
jgi:hypothetical protein